MSTITPDDIPASVTRLIYGDPVHKGDLKISQNECARMIAHYWPEIEQHIREQVAQEIEAHRGNGSDTTAYMAAMNAGFERSAAIARRSA